MSQSTIRPIGPDERPEPSVETVSAAAEHGSRLDVLIAMRRKIATTLDGEVAPRDLAALTKRLADLTLDIESLQATEAGVAKMRRKGSSDAFNAEAI